MSGDLVRNAYVFEAKLVTEFSDHFFMARVEVGVERQIAIDSKPF